MAPCNIVWLRRDLRLHDHAAFSAALAKPGLIQPVFVFDSAILKRFCKKNDRRLSFLAHTVCALHKELNKRGCGLLVLHGDARDVIPHLAGVLNSALITTAEDYEPDTRARDAHVAANVENCEFLLVKDHVILAPEEVSRNGAPYKVYTPYSRAWLEKQVPDKEMQYTHDDTGRYADYAASIRAARSAGLDVLDVEEGPRKMLLRIGYDYVADTEWSIEAARERLNGFIKDNLESYASRRDSLGEDGTSKISPYLRFGLLSIRECYQQATKVAGAQKWLNELIWREFYAMILYHFPESVTLEWNPAYRNRIEWEHNEAHFTAWQEGRTGYPVVDAAMRQLLETGWIHNRARMIVASFLTKHLLIDWRRGEEHFAQYLMDYELASNVGGWQWAASTGTDAQPYFRVFNPYLQSEKFDPDGGYIRRYVPELRHVKGQDIHCPPRLLAPDYPPPIVEHKHARERAIARFKL